MKKTISKSLVTLIVLFLTVFSSSGASVPLEWAVNPADYRYDMSLYFNVAFATNGQQVNLSDYEVASFVGDECRGVAESISGVENCLYMRIRSNTERGEAVSFKIRDKQTGDVTDIEGVSVTFESNKAIGLPSSPYNISIVKYFDVSITAASGGSVNIDGGRYPEGSKVEISAIPDAYYKFVKWSDDVTEQTRTITVDRNIILEASFEVNTYTLKYIVDGEEYSSYQIGYGSSITPEVAPEKEGYTFSGWQGLPETMPGSDVTVTGTFTVNTYNLIYMLDGAEYKRLEVAYGEKLTAEAAPEKEGHTFSGWEGLPETMPASDVTVTGSFTADTYTLTYMLDGEEYKSVKVAFGEKLTAEAAPEKEGHTFSGWEGLPETMPASDVTVTGTFTVNTYNLIYMLDGAEYKRLEVAYGEKLTAEAAPEKEGHTFSGWEGLPETMPASDVTVTGSFTADTYTLTYMLDGEEYKSVKVAFGEKLTAEAAPEKEGHTFSGWEGLPETMPASDVTVTGTFTVNTYNLIYMVDGEEYKRLEVAYGEKLTAEAAPVKDGYTFSGWQGLPETMPASDVTVTGSFSTNSYTLTYVVDGEVYKTFQFAYGEKLTAEAAPEKEGHTFSGWEGLPETMPASDVTVTGTFTVNTYNLIYMVDGEEYKRLEVAYGEKLTAEAAPEKEGHTFSGWEGLPETMPASDVTVTGSFTADTYTLTYMLDGEEYKSVKVAFGEKLTAEAAPEKEGHTFSGWEGLPETMPASDVTVTGTFTVNTYNLIYMLDGAEYKRLEVAYGEKLTAEAAPEKEGHTFSGWEGLPETMPASDVTVTGSFTADTYTLTYMLDGEEYKSVKVAFGEKLTAEAAPEKEGHTFSGWEGLPETMPASDVTVTGTFTVNTYNLIYIVDGEEYKRLEVAYGEKLTAEAAPEKEGHTFSGWEGLPETMPASDVTVTGTFTVNTYNLIYMVDGEEYKRLEVAYGEKLTAEAAPVKDGYTFSGWQGLPETMPASDVTVTGSFSTNSYTLTYVVDGEVYKTFQFAFGEKLTAEAAPEKEGHTFSGWEGLPETMPASDVTVTGTFTVNTYNLIYMVDGEEYKRLEVAYGEKLTAEAAPEKEGYTFSGWQGLPETMPASDVTVTGSFSTNSYTLTYVVDGAVYKTFQFAFGEKLTAEAAPEKEGHTFSGWEGLPETMPASDVTVTGTFTVNTYNLIYMVDGEEYKRFEIAYGEKLTAEAAPVKDGYTFSGWQGLPETMPASDVTVTGSFSTNTYNLIYMVDGEEYKRLEVAYGEKLTAEAAPEKEGHTFSGWEGLPETMPASDVTVTGTFTVNTYNLIYMVDGEEYKRLEVAYGEKLTAEAAPEKEGYTFSGWQGLPETMPASDVTVTGSFSTNSYTLTYVVDGEVYKTFQFAFGEKLTAEAAPEKEGHTFSGWEGLPETMPASDVTVTGTFTVNTYNLIYMVDGEEYKRLEVAYGEKLTAEAAPEKEGHTFSGWEGLPETMPASDVTVSGTFTVNTYTLIYMLDGETYKSVQIEYGSKVNPEAAPEKEGHTFSGWEGLPETMPASDITVNGKYAINSYVLTYMVDDEVYVSMEVEYGARITPEDAPEKEGHTFSGWDGLPDTMPSHDVTVNAYYIANYYKLTAYIDGEVYFETELLMGASVEIPEPQFPSGKIFNGWIEEVPETMPAHDVEIHGTTSVFSTLTNIFVDENALLTVYNLKGMLVLKDVTIREASQKLSKGIYIINGKKILIK